MNRLFITGTGTNVGKTIVTAGMASLGVAFGKRVVVVKPVQTGLSEYASDIREISTLAPGIVDIPPESASSHIFKLPASPHLAASDEGRHISIDAMLEFIENVEIKYNPELLIIEGAGGVLVPLNEKQTMLDFIEILGAPVIVVSLAGLGTINHTLLTLDALKQRKTLISGVVINRYPAIPGLIECDNVATIEKFSNINVIAEIKEFTISSKQKITPSELFNEFHSHPSLYEIIV